VGHGTAIESLNERIAEYDRRIEQITKEVYPQVAVLKQVKEVGPLIALTFVLTLDDPYRSPQQGGEVFSRIASRS
jgi:transposase